MIGQRFGYVCLGAAGVVSVASHIVGARIHEMLDLLEEGDLVGARLIHHQLLPLFHGLFETTNPILVKAALGLIGKDVGPPRLPLVPADEQQTRRLRAVLQETRLR